MRSPVLALQRQTLYDWAMEAACWAPAIKTNIRGDGQGLG